MSIIGQTLDNRYQIIEEIGQGQFSIVYLAQDKRIQREVAVKKFTKYDDIDMQERFKQEAFLTGQLRHNYIVEVFDFFYDNSTSYIVMPYCPDTLEKRLFKKKLFSLPEAIEIMKQVCEGLSQAHNFKVKGKPTPIVHCDLKPGNILFDQHNLVQITDFGIAHMPASNLTQSVFITGTLPYMSPEQLNGKRTFPQIDIYAMGAIFYQMLTGRYYLNISEDPSPMAKARNIFSICESPPLEGPLAEKHVPQPIVELILKALSKEPEERYHQAGEMFEALQKATRVQLSEGSERDIVLANRHKVQPVEQRVSSTTPAANETNQARIIKDEVTAAPDEVQAIEQRVSSITVGANETNQVKIIKDEVTADRIQEQEQLPVLLSNPPVKISESSSSKKMSSQPKRIDRSRYHISSLSPNVQLVIGFVALFFTLLLVGFVVSQFL